MLVMNELKLNPFQIAYALRKEQKESVPCKGALKTYLQTLNWKTTVCIFCQKHFYPFRQPLKYWEPFVFFYPWFTLTWPKVQGWYMYTIETIHEHVERSFLFAVNENWISVENIRSC